MEILATEEIRAWDQFTITEEPVASIDLMERAAMSCYRWLMENGYTDRSFSIYCGKGNNGGDGLALARILCENGCPVTVHILEFGHKGTDDFQVNLARLHQSAVPIRFVQTEAHFHPIPAGDLVIDALFGSGLNRPLEGLTARLVQYLNAAGNEIIAIDMPSGLYAGKSTGSHPVVHARHTLSFQCYKLAFLMPENAGKTGEVHILDIGLHPGYPATIRPRYRLIDKAWLRSFRQPRSVFSHKGNFGHALLMTGSYGKMGAAVLASRACLRSGVGLLTVAIPRCGYPILQTAVPEAMALTDPEEPFLSVLPMPLSGYAAVGIGPGIGTREATGGMLVQLLESYGKPLVLDADALNLVSEHREWLSLIPPGSVLTPHPKEFERLFGSSADDFERIALAQEMAARYRLVIVLKGHRSFVTAGPGDSYFNTTGNAGMATGGSGDVLTGIVTGLLAQGYTPLQAATAGVYLHGLAGDLALDDQSMESMIPSDLIAHLGRAFRELDI